MISEQRSAFLQILRLIQGNAISHVLGILDSLTYLSQSNEELLLKSEQDGVTINGDLQDIFLNGRKLLKPVNNCNKNEEN